MLTPTQQKRIDRVNAQMVAMFEREMRQQSKQQARPEYVRRENGK